MRDAAGSQLSEVHPRDRQVGKASYTSRRAYREHVVSGRATSQRAQIIECVRAHGVPVTRRQIAELTRIPINAVTPAVLSLLRAGFLRVAFEDVDQGSQAKAQFVEAVMPAPAQRDFRWPKEAGPAA